MAVKMIQSQDTPLVVTFLTFKNFFTRLQVLVEEHTSTLNEKVKNSIRYVFTPNDFLPI